MKKRLIICVVVLLAVSAHAQIDFTEVTRASQMEAVWSRAESENRPVFVDVFAAWCGPCKWMDANVFRIEQVGAYMNDAYINVRIDADRDYGKEFTGEYRVTAYPTLLVLSPGKEVMKRLEGALPYDQFLAEMRKTQEFYPALEMLGSKFEAGLLKKGEYGEYVRVLRKMGQERKAARVAGTYMDRYMEEDSLGRGDLEVIAFYVSQESDLWQKMVERPRLLKDALGDELMQFLNASHEASIMAAVEQDSMASLYHFLEVLPELARGTELNVADMRAISHVYFYHYTGRLEDLKSYIDDAYRGEKSGDHQWLFNAASNAVFLDPSIGEMAAKGVEWFRWCLEEVETFDYYTYLGLSQYYSGNITESLDSFRKAEEMVASEEDRQMIDGLLEEVQAELNEGHRDDTMTP